jgi:hypothetical protein
MRRVSWSLLGKAIGLLALLPIIAAGCSGGKVNIAGKVFYKGTPLKGGNVTFNSTEKKYSPSARIGEDGSYSIANIPSGEFIITVETASLRPTGMAPAGGVGSPGKKPGGPHDYAPPTNGNSNAAGYTPPVIGDMSKRYVPIPEEYSNVEKTKLPPYTVKWSESKHDINLD